MRSKCVITRRFYVVDCLRCAGPRRTRFKTKLTGTPFKRESLLHDFAYSRRYGRITTDNKIKIHGVLAPARCTVSIATELTCALHIPRDVKPSSLNFTLLSANYFFAAKSLNSILSNFGQKTTYSKIPFI